MNHDIPTIARFFSSHPVIAVAELGHGNINDTYLITDTKHSFILQRLNPAVFKKPTLIFANQLKLQQLLQTQIGQNKRFHIPQLLLTTDGKSHHKDPQHHYWRGLEFIENSQEIPHLLNHQAHSVGTLLGTFHGLGQLQPDLNFHDTLPGLHATSQHIQRYNSIKDTPVAGSSEPELAFCHTCIADLQHEALHIDLQLNSTIPKRLTHGDPKLANILFNRTSNKACSLIDLDTIGPGFIHHDLSDLIRSCCNRAGEESAQAEINFNLKAAQDIITGYATQTAAFLSHAEVNLLGESLWLIPFELGVRFLCDYLSGSIYFKTSSPHQNLTRACNQFYLASQIRNVCPTLQNHITTCFN